MHTAPRPYPRLSGALAPLAAMALALTAATGSASAQAADSLDVNVAGGWHFDAKGSFDDPTFKPNTFTLHDFVYLQQADTDLIGITVEKLGKCGVFTAPLTGSNAGDSFTFEQVFPVISTEDCSQIGLVTLQGTATLSDGAHATVVGDGNIDSSFLQSTLTFSAKLVRKNGLQTPTDPDGDGPGVPLAQIGSGAPGVGGANDLAVLAIKAPQSVTAKGGNPFPDRVITVQIQNRGQHSEQIPNAVVLGQLVTLQADAVGGGSPSATLTLLPPASGKFPIVLAPRQKLVVRFSAAFSLGAFAPGSSVPTLSWSAAVHHDALPGAIADDHPADDVCPRSIVAPYTFDSYPDGKIKELGAGGKEPDGTLGAPVVTTLVTK